MTLRTAAIATATFACAALFSPGWSEQGGVSLSVSKAEAYTRLYIHPAYSAVYVPSAGLANGLARHFGYRRATRPLGC
jgi:hypothetical protein